MSRRRPEHLRAELDVVATMVNDLLEYKLGTRNPLAAHACQKWIGRLMKHYNRMEPHESKQR